MNTIHFKADNFRVYTEGRYKAILINSFKSDLIKNGISKSIADILEININISNTLPRKICFDIKINDDEYYYSDLLRYIDLTTRYTPEAYVISHRVADEFAKDLQEYIDDYIKQIGTDTSNLPKNISFLEAYEFIFNNTDITITHKWNKQSAKFNNGTNLAMRNSVWDPDTYLVFDKINRKFFFYPDYGTCEFNIFKIDPDVLNNDKWSIIEYKSG